MRAYVAKGVVFLREYLHPQLLVGIRISKLFQIHFNISNQFEVCFLWKALDYARVKHGCVHMSLRV